MDERQIARLTSRVHRIEQQIAEMQERLGMPVEQTAPPAPEAIARPSPPSASPARMPRPTPIAPSSSQRDEADVIGSWFARSGGLALLVGLGFAFKYSVDRGLIGPGTRVLLGLAGAASLVGASEWGIRRDWRAWAQAVAGAGVALAYLSLLAAIQLYDLIDPVTGFLMLVVITGLGAYISLRHDSIALALLASIGAYVNAVLLTSADSRPTVVFLYLVAVDVGILFLALLRRWRALDVAAAMGTLVVFGLAAGNAPFGTRLAFATLLVALFAALPIARLSRRDPSQPSDVLLITASSLTYFMYVVDLLGTHGLAELRGWFALAVAVALASVGLAIGARDLDLSDAFTLLAVAAGAGFVAIQFEPEFVGPGWAAEGALVIAVATGELRARLRLAGALLIALSLLAMIGAASHLAPTRLLVSPQGAAFTAEVVSLGAAAWFLRRNSDTLPATSWVVVSLAAVGVLLAWTSAEVALALERAAATRQATQFSVSATWAVFAAALLATGLRLHIRWVRLAGVALFVALVGKLIFVDVWTLTSAFRVIAFVGLGGVLLGCSLAYQFFRDAILEEDESAVTGQDK